MDEETVFEVLVTPYYLFLSETFLLSSGCVNQVSDSAPYMDLYY